MPVEMPLRMRLFVCGLLMKAHRVRKARGEEIVVARGQLPEYVGQSRSLCAGEMIKGRDQRFEGPDGPERHKSEEAVVLAHQPFLLIEFCFEVVAQQAGALLLAVAPLSLCLSCGFVGYVFRRPDLAVGMRIARAHHGAAIFKDLHVTGFILAAKLPGLLDPRLDDAFNLGLLHLRQREAVVRVKAENAAGASLLICAEQRVLPVLRGRRGIG